MARPLKTDPKFTKEAKTYLTEDDDEWLRAKAKEETSGKSSDYLRKLVTDARRAEILAKKRAGKRGKADSGK